MPLPQSQSQRPPLKFDVIVLGAGGAGLMCAQVAGKRGRRVLVLDHSNKVGGKILISGGGRCNFTNLDVSEQNFVCQNPHFPKSALARYPSQNFIDLVEKHKIPYYEKKLGQLFCQNTAKAIVEMLKLECHESQVKILLEHKIERVSKVEDFMVITPQGEFACDSLVIATGGLSIPKLGATGIGHRLARQFGLKVLETYPALDGFTFSPIQKEKFSELAGISVDCAITAGGKTFRENILFTHTGLSGPAALQASLYWRVGEKVQLKLLPEISLSEWLKQKCREENRSLFRNLLSELLPARFVALLCSECSIPEVPWNQIPEKQIKEFIQHFENWELIPNGTVGYSKAEVTRGGVDTDELSSKTMESKKIPGLYFIGEVVDVTGELGGFNFQWAWASGHAAGLVV